MKRDSVSVTEKVTENKTKGEKLKALCTKCGSETHHEVIQSHDCELTEVHEDDGWIIRWEDQYQIIRCLGCSAVTFRQLSWFEGDADEYDDGTTEQLYPKRNNSTRANIQFPNVPVTLRRIYRETIDCFNSESMTLCAAGLRAIVEGICAELGISDGPVIVVLATGTRIDRKGNLEGKIAGLCERKVLSEANSNALHEHRFLGNKALHELGQASIDEIALALDIIEHTLEALYEIPDKASKLKGKRDARVP